MIIGIENQETWKPIDGFDDYEVSSLGRIKSCKRKNHKILAQEIDKDGYRRISLHKDRKIYHFVVSRIVCAAFNGNPPVGFDICCHEDNDKSNNTFSNLRWDTQKGNISDKVLHGTHQIGSRHPMAEISESDAVNVKNALCGYAGIRGKLIHVAKVTGISYHIVADISRGKTWGHV